MNYNAIIHKLVESKFGWAESSVSSNENGFVVTSNNGETLTNKDFTVEEIQSTKNQIQLEIDNEKETSANEKAALVAKLAALGLTSDDLKALGLGGN